MSRDAQTIDAPRQDASAGGARADACRDLVISLDRLFNLAALYPPGHVRCREISDEFSDRLKGVLGSETTLRINIRRDGLLLAGHLLGADTPGLQRCYDILESQGISLLEMDTAASAEDIRELAVLLLNYRHMAESAQEYQQFDYESLPATLRVTQRHFGDSVGGRAQQQIEAAVQSVMDVMESWELEDDQRNRCCRILDDLLTKATERLESDHAAELDLPLDEAADGADLGAEMLQYVVREMLPEAADANAAHDRFDLAQTAVDLTGDGESVDLMIDLMRRLTDREGDLAEEDGRSAPMPMLDYKLPLEELRGRIDQLRAETQPIISLVPDDSSEQLSILIQTVLSDTSSETASWLHKQFETIISGRLSEREKSVLDGAVLDTLAGGDTELLDHLLPWLVRALRVSRWESPGTFLARIGETVPADQQDMLWPHMVNEVMVSFEKEDDRVIQTLNRIIMARVSDEDEELINRLATLDALREDQVSAVYLRSPLLWFPTVAARLLQTSREKQIGALVYASFVNRQRTWPGSQVLDFLPGYRTVFRDFFARLLTDSAEDRISDELKAMGGRILVKAIPSLAPGRREEDWVPRAIIALGALGPTNCRVVLNQILRERRRVIWHVWPSACRSAAREAMKLLRARNRHTPGNEAERS